jgi:hypothetical protein
VKDFPQRRSLCEGRQVDRDSCGQPHRILSSPQLVVRSPKTLDGWRLDLPRRTPHPSRNNALSLKRMNPEDFFDYWRRSYGEVPPVGHILRTCFPQRWLRIHNLPESKRYAETEDEHQEILHRQNGLISELIGEGGPCELVFGYYDEEERLPEDVVAALRSLKPEFLVMLSPDESGLEREYPLLKASFGWRQKSLDTVLLAVANDVLETPLIISTNRFRIIAPYDGGVDIIVESEEARDQLKMRYASWLSKHPAGL